jgi:hypothetical protein
MWKSLNHDFKTKRGPTEKLQLGAAAAAVVVVVVVEAKWTSFFHGLLGLENSHPVSSIIESHRGTAPHQ